MGKGEIVDSKPPSCTNVLLTEGRHGRGGSGILEGRKGGDRSSSSVHIRYIPGREIEEEEISIFVLLFLNTRRCRAEKERKREERRRAFARELPFSFLRLAFSS